MSKITPTEIAEIIAKATLEAVTKSRDDISAGKKTTLFVTAEIGYGIRYSLHSSLVKGSEYLIASISQHGDILFKAEYDTRFSTQASSSVDAMIDVICHVIDLEERKVSQ